MQDSKTSPVASTSPIPETTPEHTTQSVTAVSTATASSTPVKASATTPPSPVSPTSAASELAELVSALDALESPAEEKDGSPSSRAEHLASAEAAFAYLYSRRETLPLDELQTLAALSHPFMEKRLPTRATVRFLQTQRPLPAQLSWTSQWLERYATLGESVRQRLAVERWSAFCQQAAKTLFAKGYDQPEEIVPTDLMADTDESSAQPLDLRQHRAWQDYYQELYSRLTSELMADRAILSGSLGKAATLTDTGITTVTSFIPVVGGTVGSTIRSGHDVLKHRHAAQIARWAKTLPEMDEFAKWLAHTLVDIRQEQLLSLKVSDFSFWDKAKQTWQAIKEKDTFNLARKLALADLAVVLELLPTCRVAEQFDEALRVAQNVATVQQAFQTHVAESTHDQSLPLPERFKKKLYSTLASLTSRIQMAEDKTVAPSTATKSDKEYKALRVALTQRTLWASAWHFRRLGAGVPDAKTQWGDWTAQLEAAGSVQQRTDYCVERYTARLARLSNAKTPDWADVVGLLRDIQTYVAIPGEQNTQHSLWSSVNKVWSDRNDTKDFCRLALSQRITQITQATDCDNLHSEVMTMINGLRQLGRLGEANALAYDYQQRAHTAWLQAQQAHHALQHTAKETTALHQRNTERQEHWAITLTTWQQKLAALNSHVVQEPLSPAMVGMITLPIAMLSASPPVAQQTQTFLTKLEQAWRKGESAEVLEQSCAEYYTLWQQQQRQGLPIAETTFEAFESALTQLQSQINTTAAQNLTTDSQQHATLTAAEQLCQTWETASEAAQACYRGLSVPETTLTTPTPEAPILPTTLLSSPLPSTVTVATTVEEKVSVAGSVRITNTPVKTGDDTPMITLGISDPPSEPSDEKSETKETKEVKRELKGEPASSLSSTSTPIALQPTLVAQTEAELGEPPCGFAVLACRITLTTHDGQSHAAYASDAHPPWALLLTDPDTQHHPYWRAYAQLLQWHFQCQHPAVLDTTQTPVWIGTPETLPPHVLAADYWGSSQNEAAQATTLFSRYQQQSRHHLRAASTQGIPVSRVYGYQGLQNLFSRPMPPATAPLKAALLDPLRDVCLQLGLYYGVSTSDLTSASKILDALERNAYLSPAFIADLRAALQWAEAKQALIEQAQQQGKPAPALTSDEQRAFQQHHQRSVEALWRTCAPTPDSEPVWRLTSKTAPQLDPLLAWADRTRETLKRGQIVDETIVTRTMDFLVAVIAHRQQYAWEDHQTWLAAIPPAQRLLYLDKLALALPPAQQSLVTRLRHIPSPSGQRLEQLHEKRQWETTLEVLWEPAEDKAREDKTAQPAPKLIRVRPIQTPKGKAWRQEPHTLTSDIAKQLFKPNGEWRDKDPKHGGNHRVYPITLAGDTSPCLWVKVYPEQPALDYLVTELDRRLGIQGTPTVELVKFQHGKHTSAAVLTSAVSGSRLQSVVDKTPHELEKLSLATFVHTLLRVLLTNPEDDKGDDYFLSPQPDGSYSLMRIDNERAFFQPGTAGQQRIFKSEHLLVKSVLYCLEQMQWTWGDDPEVAKIVADFLSLKPVDLIGDLLQSADQLHDGWNVLFSETELRAHFHCKDPWASLPVMCIPNGLARELITRLTTLHSALRLGYSQMTGLQLLKVTQPKLAQYYQESHTAPVLSRTPRKSISILDGKKQAPPPSAMTTTDPPASNTDHSRVKKRFDTVAGKLYKKDKKDTQDCLVSVMPHSVAIQSSLRIESPIDPGMLAQIRAKKTCSAQQQLNEFMQWHKSHRAHLFRDLLAQKRSAAAEWQGLPLRHQNLMFKALQKEALAGKLSIKQQAFILGAMVNIPWPQLDLRGFTTALTDKLLEPLLKSAGEHLLVLNLPDCSQLTDKNPQYIRRYTPNLRRLHASRSPWRTVDVTGLAYLQQLDLTESSIEMLMGESPQLQELCLKNCRQLESIGKKQLLQRKSFLAPGLRQLDISGCTALKDLRLETLQSAYQMKLTTQWSGCSPQIWVNWLQFLYQQKHGVTSPLFALAKEAMLLSTNTLDLSKINLNEYELEYLCSLLALNLPIAKLIARIKLLPNEIKVGVFGGYTGKSCFVARFVRDIFDTYIDSTFEDSFRKTIRVDDIDYLLDILDTNWSYEEYSGMQDGWVNQSQVYLICCDRESYNVKQAEDIINKVKTQNGWSSDEGTDRMILVRTQSDRDPEYDGEPGSTSIAEIKALAARYHLSYFECSAKTGAGVKEVFEAAVRQYMKDFLKNFSKESAEYESWKKSTFTNTFISAVEKNYSLMAIDIDWEKSRYDDKNTIMRLIERNRKLAARTESAPAREHSALTAPAAPFQSPGADRDALPPHEHRKSYPLPEEKAVNTPTQPTYATFFPPVVPDEKAQRLFSDIRAALDQAYPASEVEHRDTRQACLTQLADYQAIGKLNKTQREELTQWLARLRTKVPPVTDPLFVAETSARMPDIKSPFPRVSSKSEQKTAPVPATSASSIGFWSTDAGCKSWLHPQTVLKLRQGTICLAQPKTTGGAPRLYVEMFTAEKQRTVHAYTLQCENGAFTYTQQEISDDPSAAPPTGITHTLSLQAITDTHHRLLQTHLPEQQGKTMSTESGQIDWEKWYQNLLKQTGIVTAVPVSVVALSGSMEG